MRTAEKHKFSNPGHLVSWVQNFVVAPNILSIISVIFSLQNVQHCKCTEHNAPDNSDTHRSLQNSGSSIVGKRVDSYSKAVTVFKHTLDIGATLFHDMKVNRVDINIVHLLSYW